MDFKFIPENFVENLEYMGVGMACIMIVILVIIGITAFLNWATTRK